VAAQARGAGAQVAHHAHTDQPHVAVGFEAVGQQRITGHAGAVGDQPARHVRIGALTAAQVQTSEIEIATDGRSRESHIEAHGAAGVERHITGHRAVLGTQSRQQATWKAQTAADACTVEPRRGIEHAAEEPQALGHRGIAQVQRPFDPCADNLQPACRAAVAGELRHQRATHADLSRRHQRPTQAHARDLIVGEGTQHHVLRAAQRHEGGQVDVFDGGTGHIGRWWRGGHARAALWLRSPA
jgi:hypothetical protein